MQLLKPGANSLLHPLLNKAEKTVRYSKLSHPKNFGSYDAVAPLRGVFTNYNI